MRRLFIAMTMFGVLMTTVAAGEAERKALAALFGAGEISGESFAPAFLAQVPVEEVRSLLDKVREQVGAPVEVTETADGYVVRTQTYRVPVQIALDASGRISTFFVRPPVPTALSLDEIVAQMRGLKGEVSLLVMRDGEMVVAEQPDLSLAVGSAFKLGVLAAVADKVAASGMGWDHVVRLEASQISLPGGVLQVLRPGSPITLDTLASLMIAISDNTAADALLDFAGRDAVGDKLRLPFVLKTREVFALKADAERRERYLAADAAGKQAVVDELAGLPTTAIGDASGAHVPGIEWEVPVTRLCALIAEVENLPYVQLSPGPVDAADWQSVAFKGGSETGVLNMTARVRDAAGHAYCAAFTWNADSALDETRAASLYAALLGKLAAD